MKDSKGLPLDYHLLESIKTQMLPFDRHAWKLCERQACREQNRSSGPRDRYSARISLLAFKTDALKMSGLRNLLSRWSSSQLFRMSDEEVIDQIAELWARGRLHVHSPTPVRVVSAPASVARTSPKVVSFPLSERKPRGRAGTSHQPPRSEPPTFSSDIDLVVQAATLVSAASQGTPFCPL